MMNAQPSITNTSQLKVDDGDGGKDFVKGNLRCPHCGEYGKRRTSNEIDITLREIFYQCPKPECSFAWKASLVFEYGISPSGSPNPNVHLMMRLNEKKLNDEGPSNQISIFEEIDKAQA